MQQFQFRGAMVWMGIVGALAASQVQGAGFQLTEQSVTGLGRAFAGFSAAGDDASAVFFNPAEMALIPDSRATAHLTYIDVGAEFMGASTKIPVNAATGAPLAPPTVTQGTDNGGTSALVPGGYYIRRLSPELVLGVGLTAPFGLSTEYARNWVGRYHAVESEVKTIDFNPAVAYQFNKQWTVGGGVSVQYIEGKLNRAVFQGTGVPDGFVDVEGDDWSLGFNLGVMFQPNDNTRFGLSYRSSVEQNLEGDRTLSGLLGPAAARNGVVGAKLDVELPETLWFSAFHQLNPQWSVLVGARWTRWSRFEELRIDFADGTDDVTPEQWGNQWAFNLGVQYQPNAAWTFRGGVAFDDSPVPSDELRTPRIPDADRKWVALGFSYHPNDRLSVDVGYAHLFVEDVRLDNTLPIADLGGGNALLDRLTGEYEGEVDIIGVSVSYSY